MIRVLIADDHGIVRSGLRMLIDRQNDMQVVAEADDGVTALEATQSHPQYAEAALRLGASGFVLTRAADTDLIGAVRRGARGRTFLSSDAQRDLMDEWIEGGREKPNELLTPRELEVVKLIAEAYTNRQIAATLNVSEKTVVPLGVAPVSRQPAMVRSMVRAAVRQVLNQKVSWP